MTTHRQANSLLSRLSLLWGEEGEHRSQIFGKWMKRNLFYPFFHNFFIGFNMIQHLENGWMKKTSGSKKSGWQKRWQTQWDVSYSSSFSLIWLCILKILWDETH